MKWFLKNKKKTDFFLKKAANHSVTIFHFIINWQCQWTCWQFIAHNSWLLLVNNHLCFGCTFILFLKIFDKFVFANDLFYVKFWTPKVSKVDGVFHWFLLFILLHFCGYTTHRRHQNGYILQLVSTKGF